MFQYYNHKYNNYSKDKERWKKMKKNGVNVGAYVRETERKENILNDLKINLKKKQKFIKKPLIYVSILDKPPWTKPIDDTAKAHGHPVKNLGYYKFVKEYMDEKSRLYEKDISQLKNFIEIWKEIITSVEEYMNQQPEYMNQQPESYKANIDWLINFANKLRQKEIAEFYEAEEAEEEEQTEEEEQAEQTEQTEQIEQTEEAEQGEWCTIM